MVPVGSVLVGTQRGEPPQCIGDVVQERGRMEVVPVDDTEVDRLLTGPAEVIA